MCSATCSHVTVLDIAVSAEWFQCWGRNQREAVRRQEDEEDGRIAATAAATFKALPGNEWKIASMDLRIYRSFYQEWRIYIP